VFKAAIRDLDYDEPIEPRTPPIIVFTDSPPSVLTIPGIYLTVTMAMTSLSIVLTVFVLQLHHVGPHQKPVPNWIKKLVIHYIARIVCMRSHIYSYYGCSLEEAEARQDDICLTSLMDNVEHKESNNCNGKLGHQNPLHPGSSSSGSDRGGHAPLRRQFSTGFGRSGSGRLAGSGAQPAHTRSVSYDRISSHLRILVSRHDDEDVYQDIVNEWRLVAHIMDRFLFWLFLFGSVVSSLCILVFKPMTKPPL